MQKTIVFILVFLIFFSCKKTEEAGVAEDFSQIVNNARGKTVHFYMWGGSTAVNSWIDLFVTPRVKAQYDISLKRVPADAQVFINKLLTEKQAGKETGSIDIIWINGENFKTAREHDLLFGPITEKLPNFTNHVDPESSKYDFGYPTDGYEAPWGKAQFVFIHDKMLVSKPPQSFTELLSWVKSHPGKFTYPAPPDFTGSAFIRQAFCAANGGYLQFQGAFDENTYETGFKNLKEYLEQLHPYLYRRGSYFPKNLAEFELLYERGEVLLSMSYNQAEAQNKILAGKYPESTRTFVMNNTSLYNLHFTAIPYNAPQKEAALTVINYLLSPEAQASKQDPANWGDFTVLDMTTLSDEEEALFSAIDTGKAVLPLSTLENNGIPELAPAYVERLEEDWETRIIGKD